MSGGVHGKTVHHFLHRKVFKLSIVVCIVLVEHGNEPAGARGVDASQASIKLHYIGSSRKGKVCNCLMGIQSKDCKRLGPIAQKKCSMMFRVQCHAVVVTASFDRSEEHTSE